MIKYVCKFRKFVAILTAVFFISTLVSTPANAYADYQAGTPKTGPINLAMYVTSDNKLKIKWWDFQADPRPLMFDIKYSGYVQSNGVAVATGDLSVDANWALDPTDPIPPQTANNNEIFREFEIPLTPIVGYQFSATVTAWYGPRNADPADYPSASATVNYTIPESAPTPRYDPGPGDPSTLPLEGCQSNTPDDLRKVLMLSIPYSEPNQDNLSGYRTDVLNTDLKLRNYLCYQAGVSLTIFDASAESWANLTNPDSDSNLNSYSDLIIPASIGYETSILADPRIMDDEILSYLKSWVNDRGGHIQLLDPYEQRTFLSEVADLDLENSFHVPSSPAWWFSRRTNPVLDADGFEQYPPNFPMDLLIDSSKYQLDFTAIENKLEQTFFLGDKDYDYSAKYLGAGLIKSGYGQIGYFSTTLFNERDSIWHNEEINIGYINDWLKVIATSLSGHFSTNVSFLAANIDYQSVGNSVVGGGNESRNAFDNGLVVRLGHLTNPISIPCANSISNPSIFRRNQVGVTLTCGKVHIDDGTSEDGIDARIIRWFSGSTGWIRTSVELSTRREFNYEGSISLFSDLGSDEETIIDRTNEFIRPESFDFDTENLTWFNTISHPDANVSYPPPAVISIPGYEGLFAYGGEATSQPWQLNSGSDNLAKYVNRSQTIIESRIKLGIGYAPRNLTLNWYTGLVNFRKGCDRIAAQVAASAANEFMNSNIPYIEDEEEFDYSFVNQSIPEMEDAFLYGSAGRYFNLPATNTECTQFEYVPDLTSLETTSNSVNVGVMPILGATRYEIQTRMAGTENWSALPEPTWQNDFGRFGISINNLADRLRFEFRARAWSGEAHGDWSQELDVRTLAIVAPTPSNTSQAPISNVTPAPNPPVAQVIAQPAEPVFVPRILAQQSAPGVPAKLKRYKKIKFGMNYGGYSLRVSSSGSCKTTAITKRVKTKVGKRTKYVKKQIGWQLTAGRKVGQCNVYFSNDGDENTSPLSATTAISIVK